MAFKDIRFPVGISYGAVGGPGYSTNILTLSSGVEGVNQNWSNARCAFNVARGCSSEAAKKEIIAFFRIARGKGNTWRYKDWTDFQVSLTEGKFLHISGELFQMQKQYTDDAETDLRDIALPLTPVIKSGATTMVLGADYTLDVHTGILTTLGSNDPTAWSGEFDVLCRFDTDTLQLVAQDFEYFKTQDIPVIEVRPQPT